MKHQRGNALFIILIGIVLFAALSYAVTGSMRTGGDMGAGEKATVQATDIVSYANSVATAVKSVMALNGCSDATINFDNSTISGYANTSSPADKSCSIFDASGGGLTWQKANPASLDSSKSTSFEYGHWFFSKNTYSVGAGASNAAPEGVDLIMILPYIKKEVCQAINKNAGYDGIISTSGGMFDSAKFRGVYQSTAYGINNATVPALKLSGCQKVGIRGFTTPEDTTPFYAYYKVLIAR